MEGEDLLQILYKRCLRAAVVNTEEAEKSRGEDVNYTYRCIGKAEAYNEMATQIDLIAEVHSVTLQE